MSLCTLRETRREVGLVRRSLGEGGFTLIELLVVITIIAVLAGLVVGASRYGLTKSATSRTKAEIKTMETALEDYKADNGVYPSPSAGGSTVLYNALAGGSKKYFNFKPDQISGTTIMDPFGNEYQYKTPAPPPALPGTYNEVTFDLWSYGPDGKSSTAAEQADDITNWQS